MIDIKKEIYTMELDDFDSDLLLVYAPLHRYVAAISKEHWNENWESLTNIIMNMPVHESIQAYMDGIPQGVYASRLRLNLTQNCNLRCTYCVVNEGISKRDITTEMIDASLYLLLSDYRKNNAKQMQITFSGGEATTRPHLLRYAIDLAKKIAVENGIDIKFHLLTNGVFGKEMSLYIADNFHKVQVSYDGYNSRVVQRPLPNGKDSCSQVYRSINRLHELGVPMNIRITVSRNNFDNITSIIVEVTQLKLGYSLERQDSV